MRISIILLAAGNSRRFCGNKLVSLWQGKPMFEWTIEKIMEIPCEIPIIVTQYKEIKQYVIKKDLENRCKVVWNSQSELGISYSIQLGIEKSGNVDAYLFLVCDQPMLRIETIQYLIKEYQESKKTIAALSYKGIWGNPTIFSSKYKEDFMQLRGDIGGKSIIRTNLEQLHMVEVKEKLELQDIDTRDKIDLSYTNIRKIIS